MSTGPGRISRDDRRILRAGRAVLAARDGRPRITDVAFVVYAGLLVALVVGAPLVRFAVLGLIEPDAAGVVVAVRPGVVALIAAITTIVVVLGGRTRGPVVPRPAAVQFLADSPLPRRLTLRRPFVASALALVGLSVLAAGVVGLSRLLVPGERATVSVGVTADAASEIGMAGPTVPVAVVAFVIGAVGFSLLLAVAWLLGQHGSRRTVAAVVIVAGVGGVLGLFVPGMLLVSPWGWLGLLWAPVAGGIEAMVLGSALATGDWAGLFTWGGGGWFASVGVPVSWWPAVALVVLGAVSLLLVPRHLDGLRSGPLLDQALRWQRVGMMLQSGDASGAVGGLRASPTSGRRVPLRMTGPFWLVVLRRSIVGARRIPGRVALGSLILAASGAAVGLSFGLPDGVRWMLAVPAAFLAYLAVGVWCDAVRHGVESAGTPTLYGRSPRSLVLAGAVAPLLAAVVIGGIGALLGVLASAAPGGMALLQPLGWWLLLAVWSVVLRTFDAAKGPLPILLLMPVPTPFGDASSLNVLVWQSDAVLLALLVGGGLTALAPVAPGAAVVLLVVVLVIVAALGFARLRKLSRPA
ncbi:hypothetical protein SAMN06295974_2269 [Plantibacter flavus]|uniref:ABC-2 type transport system permease protein n=1 Tax=Plantibacter flavus TaxID=150123 RepID=A0A3N2BZA4_9MICO|nr:hypothetical protein [Plantibacter flavus]ROR80567.1 hypothetical protein EDD42_0608 [Plantibacter flavus]SMG33217.1 hypothetical protein SAMN06295974_2269 [Plantibacter flavus]